MSFHILSHFVIKANILYFLAWRKNIYHPCLRRTCLNEHNGVTRTKIRRHRESALFTRQRNILMRELTARPTKCAAFASRAQHNKGHRKFVRGKRQKAYNQPLFGKVLLTFFDKRTEINYTMKYQRVSLCDMLYFKHGTTILIWKREEEIQLRGSFLIIPYAVHRSNAASWILNLPRILIDFLIFSQKSLAPLLNSQASYENSLLNKES